MTEGRIALDSATIVAIATPPGRGAVALVRLSGGDAARIASKHVDPWPPSDRVATLCAIRSADGEIVDHALVTLFEAPRTYTGETVVEISTHGGSLTPALVMEQLVSSGARPALPGEFTRRAVLNGRMDLIQAEAVTDLVDAASRHMQQAAVRQLDGGLSRRIDDLRSSLLDIEALLAYDIDFPDEDEGPVGRERVEAAIDATLAEMDALLATAQRGELVRDGAVVVIAGAPNVGKSSLFNALIGRARAIVTDVPGTTRDALEAVIDGKRWPLRLVDTAGMRPTDDIVERLGVELSERHVANAQVVLACGDSAESIQLVTSRIAQLETSAAIITVRTKSDLVSNSDQIPQIPQIPQVTHAASVSAQAGTGLSELVAAVEEELGRRFLDVPEMPVVIAARHRSCLLRARNELAEFRAAWADGSLPATVAAVHLRSAVGALEELIGSVDIEDVLDRVFSGFCIGK